MADVHFALASIGMGNPQARGEGNLVVLLFWRFLSMPWGLTVWYLLGKTFIFFLGFWKANPREVLDEDFFSVWWGGRVGFVEAGEVGEDTPSRVFCFFLGGLWSCVSCVLLGGS